MENVVKFAVGGPVQVKEGTYLLRPADTDLFEACKASEFAYVLASRQIGKSSLMFETAKRLHQQGIRAAVIDLNSIGHAKDADTWYFTLIDKLTRKLDLEVDVLAWWDESSRSTLTHRFLEFLREVVLKEITAPIVIFIDEIDVTLGLDFTDDFFAAIRTIYNGRADEPAYQRLSFVLLGVATPDELIEDNARTPFNIGRAIALCDFTSEECDRFRQAIEAKYSGRNFFDQIYDWTAGHPYLIQKLCEALLKEPEPDGPDLVEKLVTELFVAPTDRIDDNLHPIESRVTGDQYAREILVLYKRILQDDEPVDDDEKSIVVNRLKLYGLIVAKNGRLKVRNKLYARAFDLAWVNKMLDRSTRLTLGLPRRYKILQEIGRGGFATIYLAETTLESGETENVALKVLNLREEVEPDAPKLIERFERESAAVTKLDHPNIIHIREAGRSRASWGDTLFIAMEYIAGGTLQRKLKTEGSLPRDEAVEIVKQIGLALNYAHEQGIIHRDIKPGNILLDTSQEAVHPVLTDFGLVKELSGDDEGHTSAPLGTPRYMTPEQLAPKRWKQVTPTPATDIYALAITFFEMLTGQHPFDADSDHKLTDAEFAEKHLNEPLPSLSRIKPEVGLFFDSVLRKATAKNPADRYEDVMQFVTALETANNEANRSRAARLVDVARDYALDGDSDIALDMIDRALEFSPGYGDALRLKGKINFEQGQIQTTLENYRQAFEQDRDPDSEAGHDYLGILKHAARDAWQQAAYQEAVTHYGAIKQILDEGRIKGVPVQIWAEAWQAFAAKHHQAGLEAYTEGSPDNIDEAIGTLKCEIEALKGLEAEQESQDLQEKLRDLQVQHHYNAGNKAYALGSPDDVLAAINVLRCGIRTLKDLQAAPESQDLQEKLRLLRVKCHYRVGAQVYQAGQPENLAEAIKVLERKIRVLKRLDAEHEARDLQENLTSCHHQAGVQAYADGHPDDIAAAIDILGREIQALVDLQAEAERQDLQAKQRKLQIKDHYNHGNHVYANGSPASLPEAIEVLKEKIVALEALAAEDESRDLDQKLKQLHIIKYNNIIEAATSAINDNGDTETIFHNYDQIDQAYQSLLELEPGHQQWTEQKRERLKEQAKQRQKFAQSAETKHQYEVALRHYDAIRDIEQSKKYHGLAQILHLDLESKIADLEEKVAYDRKYQAIKKRIDEQEYADALNQLVEDFISKETYGHRDVARLLWGLTYAKQHDWQFPPPEWESAAELKKTQEKLAFIQKELDQVRKELATVQNESAKMDSGQSDKMQKKLQKLERRWDTRLSFTLVIPSVIIGVVIGILVDIIAPQDQNLTWLAAIAILAILALAGLRIITKRMGE